MERTLARVNHNAQYALLVTTALIPIYLLKSHVLLEISPLEGLPHAYSALKTTSAQQTPLWSIAQYISTQF